jgi:hypothetical protein
MLARRFRAACFLTLFHETVSFLSQGRHRLTRLIAAHVFQLGNIVNMGNFS